MTLVEANPVASLRDKGAKVPAVEANDIALNGISKIFTTRRGDVHALDDVNLSIRRKEFVCLLGPSGCGKSTILALIAGLAKPSVGAVTVDGRSVDEARRNNRIGLVFQDAVLLPWRTANENVSLPLEVLKIPRQERNDKSRRRWLWLG